MQDFKFASQPELAGLFADALARALQLSDAARDIQLLLPVPLSNQRLLQRGYDQAW